MCTTYFAYISFYIPRYIRRGKSDAGFPLFQSESLKWPGFVEFDDVNGKVLTYSAHDRYLRHSLIFRFHFYCYVIICSAHWLFCLTFSSNGVSIYKVFDLKNYTMLYSISDRHVQEIKIRYFLFSRVDFLLHSSGFCKNLLIK